MGSQNSKYWTERFDSLSEQDRAHITEHVLDFAADHSMEKSKQFDLIPMSDLYDDIKARMKNWGRLYGLRTGNWVLDKMTMGLAPGEMTIIGGATSNGKTALAINIAANIAKMDKTVLFVTMEMTREEAGVRFLKVLGEANEFRMGNILFQSTDELDWKSIDGLMQRAKDDAGADLVVIDHLHYFTRELENVAEDLGRITKEIKKNAIRHKLPVILLSHTRKKEGSETRTGINDLRGSSYIAQDADVVLMVYKDLEHPKEMIVTLEKNRNRYGCDVGSDYIFPFENLIIEEPTFNPNFGVSRDRV